MNAFTIRVLGGVGLMFVLFFGFQSAKNHYIEQGRNEVRHEYMESERIAILRRNAENERILIQNAAKNIETITEYENKLKDQASDYDKRIAIIKRDGGLRIPKTACSRPAAETDTASSTGDNETSTDRLPIEIERGLFDLAREADKVVTQLGACQSWIKDNGFYK